ncbi:MAG TPA: hypothetical protein GXX57_01505 [Firmicutes bacterium]|nr:hypothetical protein [Bacillota bacterium]
MEFCRSLVDSVLREIAPRIEEVRKTEVNNQAKVLAAFHKARVADYHFTGSTGYGYGDVGREVLEEVYADIFRTESALVRPQIVSGTHGITCCLFGLLKPQDLLLSVTGAPYDTLQMVIGQKGDSPNSLKRWQIEYQEINLFPDGQFDPAELAQVTRAPKLILMQRSRGYSLRPALTVAQIGEAVKYLEERFPEAIIFLDNCYGEFVEEKEPTEVGVHLAAGSLIKNPGGTIAPGGGYVVGREDLVVQVAEHLTAPGLGDRLGPSFGLNRLLYQGLWLAPHMVAEALCGAILVGAYFSKLGFEVHPGVDAPRGDVVQVVVCGDPELQRLICQAVQETGAVDHHFALEPSVLPGYDDPVIMASGSFIQGSSSELSADGPVRPPYAVYFQGGTSLAHWQLALMAITKKLRERSII